jgi:hypothetical protein
MPKKKKRASAKNPTKKYLTKKLDKITSRIIRSRGECERCMEQRYEKLQCCHIYSRVNRAVRWDFGNLFCLCASCHTYFHQHPLEFAEFTKLKLGVYRYGLLKDNANSIRKWTIEEMQELLRSYNEMFEDSF